MYADGIDKNPSGSDRGRLRSTIRNMGAGSSTSSSEEINEEPKKQIPDQLIQEKHMHVLKQPINNDQNKFIPNKEPHMYQAIIKNADEQIKDGRLLNKINSSGIFLQNRKQKYWVDKTTGHNCFMLFARSLSITWSDDDRFWLWVSLKESSGEEIEVANLIDICWLEIHGRFEASHLTPGAIYEVVFIVNMELGYGWARPVTLRLKLPNGVVQQHEECLLELPKCTWVELKAGEFKAESKIVGEMEFSMYEYEGGQWKRGLIVKGVAIRPKKQ